MSGEGEKRRFWWEAEFHAKSPVAHLNIPDFSCLSCFKRSNPIETGQKWRSMRKVVTLLFSVSLLFFLSLPVRAEYYWPSVPTIQSMQHAWDAENSTSGPLSIINEGTAMRFAASLQYGDGSADGWAAVGIGYPWGTIPPEIADLSGYDGVQLAFLNTNNSLWLVNLYMNTGWTDPPYNEPDNFYQDGWIPLLPGQTTIVTLDFASVGAINLNHVTNFGFQIGANMDEYPMWDPMNPSNGDIFHIDVSQVPEPITIMLLGLGAFALRRR